MNALDAYRRWGFLQARLDNLGRLPPLVHPELEGLRDSRNAKRWYCGTIGVEFMHLPFADRVRWIQERMESDAALPEPEPVLDRLLRAEILETSIQKRYIGTKRFSLEGAVALLPMLAEIVRAAAGFGAEEMVLAASHRGRLNLMTNLIGRDPADIFAQFEDVDPRTALGGGDVKYHLGATGRFRTEDGRTVRLSLTSNPSHLEAVSPVAIGRVRARQDRRGDDGRKSVWAVVLHGDAAFAGQGIVAETLNLAGLPGYDVGGTIHIVVNNLVGFTTTPESLHTSRFATDAVGRGEMPVFHVNAEDPDAAVRVGGLAAEYRRTFGGDIVVDLIGHRRHGHSEVDDPRLTQPLLYREIDRRPPLSEAYARHRNLEDAARARRAEAIAREMEAALDKVGSLRIRPQLKEAKEYWKDYQGGRWEPGFDVETGVENARLQDLGRALTRLPKGFAAHPKIVQGLDQRMAMIRGDHPVNWATAETLAFASLLRQGVRVRLTGQDTRRGTFNQRHSVLFDSITGAEWVPLRALHAKQGAFDVYDSPLSEAAPLGFEFGYTRDAPDALVLWEAQFGDFVNGAQVVIDQFLSSAEDKWGLLSGLVLLLPHGYEGQGPEHSSARVERFLQLAGEDNFQVCWPTRAAQYFHLLRRQALTAWRKPLVVLTPKSMMRSPAAASPLADFETGRFRTVIEEDREGPVERIVVASGKLVHELRDARTRRRHSATIVSLEQLYPFPAEALHAALARHPGAREIVWAQEEPANMGALSFVLPRLERLADGRPVRTVKRRASASPATGSVKAHELEQTALVELTFLDPGEAKAM